MPSLPSFTELEMAEGDADLAIATDSNRISVSPDIEEVPDVPHADKGLRSASKEEACQLADDSFSDIQESDAVPGVPLP